VIGEIGPEHYEKILRLNQEFVHWLAPMDIAKLKYVLSIASYKRQTQDGQGVLIGYAHDANYPDHKNLRWLRAHVRDFYYIDRVIIDEKAQGKGYGRRLYADVEEYARAQGYAALACEVNTRPNNPGSHAFHTRLGFQALGDVDYPDYDAALRYYAKPLRS